MRILSAILIAFLLLGSRVPAWSGPACDKPNACDCVKPLTAKQLATIEPQLEKAGAERAAKFREYTGSLEPHRALLLMYKTLASAHFGASYDTGVLFTTLEVDPELRKAAYCAIGNPALLKDDEDFVELRRMPLFLSTQIRRYKYDTREAVFMPYSAGALERLGDGGDIAVCADLTDAIEFLSRRKELELAGAKAVISASRALRCAERAASDPCTPFINVYDGLSGEPDFSAKLCSSASGREVLACLDLCNAGNATHYGVCKALANCCEERDVYRCKDGKLKTFRR